ncbi:MAG: MoxR family ATPase [Oscillospiraceae bacterium]
MNQKTETIIHAIEQVIIGKRPVIEKLLAALLCGGHILIEDVPGVGKTKLAAALAGVVGGKFNRIQLTPDIMPSDILGFSMVNQRTGEMEYRQGAAVCNFLLADEINRASPKVQSSLLEVMEEHQISLDGKTIALPKPFMTLATQNPVETYGTFHLPEAQMDRFLMKVSMGYPAPQDELSIIANDETGALTAAVSPVASPEEIVAMQDQVRAVFTSEAVKSYILALVTATRTSPLVKLGASPRASIALNRTAKAHAYLNGRDFTTPDDVKSLAESVLAHRLILSPEGKTRYGSNEACAAAICAQLTVPVGN